MQNVYDELIDRNLIHIIPELQVNCEQPETIYKDTAIAVNLYYEDTLQRYFKYLDNVPEKIEVYIFSSNEKTWEKIYRYANEHENIFFYKKENRGRDISAFLIGFRKIALKKRYLCFLHDKREKSSYLKDDTDYWIENLWGNTINSKTYIQNVLEILNNSKIGILAPPIPFGDKFPYWYTNQWSFEDLYLTKKLADELGLECDINAEKTAITLGSVFWCKTDAIKKILEYDWKYDIFHEEPLPSDGTISHAIERIFAYVAQDAGYTTEWILCSEYACSLILKCQRQMTETYNLLKKNFIANNLSELRNYNNQKEEVREFCLGCKRVYLYGAGEEGRKYALWMYLWEIKVDGFVVTTKKTDQKKVLGIPIYLFEEVDIEETVGIIITVGSEYLNEIEDIIKNRGILKYYKPIRNQL